MTVSWCDRQTGTTAVCHTVNAPTIDLRSPKLAINRKKKKNTPLGLANVRKQYTRLLSIHPYAP